MYHLKLNVTTTENIPKERKIPIKIYVHKVENVTNKRYEQKIAQKQEESCKDFYG